VRRALVIIVFNVALDNVVTGENLWYPFSTFVIGNSLIANNYNPNGRIIGLGSRLVAGIIHNTTFQNNTASTGGCFYVASSFAAESTLRIENNSFYNNFGDQAGAIFFETHKSIRFSRNVLLNNEAYFYGHTFAGPAISLVWVKPFSNKTNILSGQVLPSFSATMKDFYDNVIVHRAILVDFVFLNLTTSNASNGLQFVKDFSSPLLQGDPAAVFDSAEAVGLPGTYEVMLAPIFNYNRKRFALYANVSVAVCSPPDIDYYASVLEKYPRCVKRKVCLVERRLMY
jgi:hypothetical protein